VRIKMDDVAPHGRALNRVTIRQKKTGQPVTAQHRPYPLRQDAG
jgi:hypothetical protein